MIVELRGGIRVANGSASIELRVPTSGLHLSQVLDRLAEKEPRIAAYLVAASAGTALRVIHNGQVVGVDNDPMIRDESTLMLLFAIAGG